MTLEAFRSSLQDPEPPILSSKVLTGLWYDANGNWEKAHDLIDGCSESNAAWAHAYLHRKEGDVWNSDYWYNKAGRSRPDNTLDQEWDCIVKWIMDNG